MQAGAAEEKFPLVLFNSVTRKWEPWHKIKFFQLPKIRKNPPFLKALRFIASFFPASQIFLVFLLQTQEKKFPLLFIIKAQNSLDIAILTVYCSPNSRKPPKARRNDCFDGFQ